jgi:hypothetical protein
LKFKTKPLEKSERKAIVIGKNGLRFNSNALAASAPIKAKTHPARYLVNAASTPPIIYPKTEPVKEKRMFLFFDTEINDIPKGFRLFITFPVLNKNPKAKKRKHSKKVFAFLLFKISFFVFILSLRSILSSAHFVFLL